MEQQPVNHTPSDGMFCKNKFTKRNCCCCLFLAPPSYSEAVRWLTES